MYKRHHTEFSNTENKLMIKYSDKGRYFDFKNKNSPERAVNTVINYG
jgi:hypothetical protein